MSSHLEANRFLVWNIVATLSLSLAISTGPAWSACTGTVVNGVIVPNDGDSISCSGGLSAVSIDNEDADNVTVKVEGVLDILQPPSPLPAINLNSVTLTNNGVIIATNAKDNLGTITIRGIGSKIVNTGLIRGKGNEAIQGNLFSEESFGATLDNTDTGKIIVVDPTGPAVNLGDSSIVTNAGEINYQGDKNLSALSVGDNSVVTNEPTGVIEASEVSGAARAVGVVNLGDDSTLTNAGIIRLIGDVNGAPRGTAVEVFDGGVVITNRGLIDASKGERAISASGAVTIVNSGEILGGTKDAIRVTSNDPVQLILESGSQIAGLTQVRTVDSFLSRKTDDELNNDQTLIDFCNQNPGERFCYNSGFVLPQQDVVLTLTGDGGSEDDKISGFSLIEKVGAGTWTLGSGFQAGSAGDSYQTGDFRDTLTIELDANGQLNLTGDITDNADGTKGNLFKNGPGLLVLSGTNTFSGTTTVNEGTLQANGGNAIGDSSAVSVVSGANLTLGANETIGSIEGDGNVNLATATLTAGGDNSSTTFSGALVGAGGLAKVGSGTLSLTGVSTGTGVLSVLDGTLNAAGTISLRAVAGPNGKLVGTGTVAALINTGRVAPGNSIGTLTVNNDYLQTAAGTLEIEIAPDGSAANDLLAVGGAANLNGTLTVKGENDALLTPAVDGNTYTIITAAGGVSGQFSSAPPLGAFTFQPTYNPNDVQLGVTYTGFSSVQNSGTVAGTGTTNQKSKAKALDKAPVTPSGLNSGNADFDQILLEIANETADELANTYNNIIAEPYAAYMTVLLEQNDYFADAVLNHAHACSAKGRATLSGDFPLQSSSEPAVVGGCAEQDRYGVWLDANWVSGDVDGSDGLSGYDYRVGGLVLGLDRLVGSNTVAGVAFGYSQSELDDYELADADIDGDSYFLSGYGTYAFDQWELAGMLGYSFGEYESDRQIRFGSIDRKASADFDGEGFISSLRAAYFSRLGRVDVVPDVGLTYSHIWQDGFTEKGANSLNLKVDDGDAYSVVTSAGVRVGTIVKSGETRIRPQLMVRYEYDWNAGDDDAHDLEATFAEVPILGSIDVVGQNRGEHGVTSAAGFTVQVTDNLDLFARTGYRWNSDGDEYQFGAGARMVW